MWGAWERSARSFLLPHSFPVNWVSNSAYQNLSHENYWLFANTKPWVNFLFKCHQNTIYQLNEGVENNRLLFFFLASRLKNVKNYSITTGKYVIVKYGKAGVVVVVVCVLCIIKLNAFKWYLPCGPATLVHDVLQPEQEHSSSFGFASFRSIDTTTALVLLGRAECPSLVQRDPGRYVAADHQMV